MILPIIGGSFHHCWHTIGTVLEEGQQIALLLPRDIPAYVTEDIKLEDLSTFQEIYVKKTFYHKNHPKFEVLVYIHISKSQLDEALSGVFINEQI